MPADTHLREWELANLVGTSRSPVRVVLEYLRDAGVARYDRNKGYFLTVDAVDIPSGLLDVEQGTRDQVYRQIARMRFEGKLADSVTEADLCRLLGAGRSDVHQAMVRARDEGWVDKANGYGWDFMPTIDTLEAYDDLYAVRLALEPACVMSTKFRPVRSELVALRGEQMAIANGDVKNLVAVELFESNSHFHATLVHWSHNTVAIGVLQRLDRLRRLTEYHQAERPLPRRELALEHCRVLDAIEAGDTMLAASLLRAHLDRARQKKAIAAAFAGRARSPIPHGSSINTAEASPLA